MPIKVINTTLEVTELSQNLYLFLLLVMSDVPLKVAGAHVLLVTLFCMEKKPTVNSIEL